jgi:predicted choloylglycine hydrolase
MKKFSFILLFLFAGSIYSYACTIFTMTRGGVTLIGNNEDWHQTDSYVRFVPSTENKYGRVLFGFGKNCRYIFGGINDQGLFYDIASLTERKDIRFDPDKETVDNPVYETMLETCASIGEAIELIRRYNVNGFKRHHIMIVDRSGKSAILEWGADSLSVMINDSDYQVTTNFNNTDPHLAGWYPCNRFEKAEDALQNMDSASIDNFRKILQSVQNNSPAYPTVYSNIYDLKNNFIYIYHIHRFEEYYKIYIHEELSKKEHSYYLPSLFSNLKLLSPVNNENVPPSSVDLVWQGNADRYKLSYTTDPDFRDHTEILITTEKNLTDNGAGFKGSLGFICLSLILLFLVTLRQKKGSLLLFIIIMLTFHFATCGNKTVIKEATKHTLTIPELESNKTYYWKVEAIQNENIITSSITCHFNTSD